MGSHFKLFISDILQMEKCPDANRYSLGEFRVKEVELVGFVKFKKEGKNNWTIYQVDDGTGVINCFYRNCVVAFPEERQNMKKISKVFLKHVKEISLARREVTVGSTVLIQGYITDYRAQTDIVITRMTPIMDKNEELLFTYEKLALYRDVYGIGSS